MNQEVKTINGYSIKDEIARKNKLEHYIVNSSITLTDLQNLLNIERAKIIEFTNGEYNFDETLILNKNTTLLLNNSTITFSVAHGFRNFKTTDTFLEYNGNGNIEITGGKIIGGAFSFCHAKDISLKNICFENCIGVHILEMMSINNLLVDSCSFKGINKISENVKEYIQIDDCQYGNFPWFDDENNPTYDGTPNKNWIIKNSEFLKPDNNDFEFATAIGGHTDLEDSYHENINIINNKFNGFNYCGVRFRNVINSKITGNYFKKDDTSNTINNIMVQVKSENILIENNICDCNNNSRFFYSNASTVKYVYIKNNQIFNFKKVEGDTESNKFCLYFRDINYISIENNNFTDFDMALLHCSSVSETENYNTIIFKCNTVISNNVVSDYLLVFDSYSDIYINDNSFILATGSNSVVRLREFVHYISMANNQINIESPLSLNGYIGTLKDIKNIAIIGYTGNASELTNQSLNFDYGDFNKIIIVTGTGGYTQTIDFRDYNPKGKLTARTYRFSLVGSSVQGYGYLTLNSDKTVNYGADIGINIRGIYLINE